jgi:hypothetical protein
MRDPLTPALKKKGVKAKQANLKAQRAMASKSLEKEAPPPPATSYVGVPPAEVLEALFSSVITNTQAAIDVAHEGTSKLTPANCIRIACAIAVMEANPILLNLVGVSNATLRVKHRLLVKVWHKAVYRMTQAVLAYEASGTQDIVFPDTPEVIEMANAVVSFTTISHLVLSEATKTAERKALVEEYCATREAVEALDKEAHIVH